MAKDTTLADIGIDGKLHWTLL